MTEQSPVDHEGRTVTRDVELSGQHLSEGDRVMLVYVCANRDESVFPHADRLDFEIFFAPDFPLERDARFKLGESCAFAYDDAVAHR